MKPHSVILSFCALVLSLYLGACTASSELGEDEHAEAAAADSASSAASAGVARLGAAHAETTAVGGEQPPAARPSATAAVVPSTRQGFTTKEDTIEVESEQRRHHSAAEQTPVTVQPHAPAPLPRSGFTVQVGAFKDEKNAERAVGVLARRFGSQTASKHYSESAKLFRITVGDFATEKEALRFAAKVKKKYPQEYSRAWVLRIAQ